MSLIAEATQRPMSIAETIGGSLVMIAICVTFAVVRIKGGARARHEADQLRVDMNRLTRAVDLATTNAQLAEDALRNMTYERDALQRQLDLVGAAVVATAP